MAIDWKKIQAVIFDMDGVIIDSEPLWRRSMCRVFPTLGIDMTEAMCQQTMGYRMDEVIRYWYDYQPWQGWDDTHGPEKVEKDIVQGVIDLVCAEGKLMAGVKALLSDLSSKGVKIGLASSSSPWLIETVLETLSLKSYFAVAHSAVDELSGKPAPDVYLAAARMLAVAPEHCLAIEDSYAGLCSAKAANMQCLVVPAPEDYHDTRFDASDAKLSSLLDISDCQ